MVVAYSILSVAVFSSKLNVKNEIFSLRFRAEISR